MAELTAATGKVVTPISLHGGDSAQRPHLRQKGHYDSLQSTNVARKAWDACPVACADVWQGKIKFERGSGGSMSNKLMKMATGMHSPCWQASVLGGIADERDKARAPR